MRSCPRKFAFQYVEKVPADFIPSSLIFGGSIHSALEFYFRARLEGLEVTQDALLSAYHDGWKRQRGTTGLNVPVKYSKDQTADSLHALCVWPLRCSGSWNDTAPIPVTAFTGM